MFILSETRPLAARLIQDRIDARRSKDFHRADDIREEIMRAF